MGYTIIYLSIGNEVLHIPWATCIQYHWLQRHAHFHAPRVPMLYPCYGGYVTISLYKLLESCVICMYLPLYCSSFFFLFTLRLKNMCVSFYNFEENIGQVDKWFFFTFLFIVFNVRTILTLTLLIEYDKKKSIG